jgi:hypothetical protein
VGQHGQHALAMQIPVTPNLPHDLEHTTQGDRTVLIIPLP